MLWALGILLAALGLTGITLGAILRWIDRRFGVFLQAVPRELHGLVAATSPEVARMMTFVQRSKSWSVGALVLGLALFALGLIALPAWWARLIAVALLVGLPFGLTAAEKRLAPLLQKQVNQAVRLR